MPLVPELSHASREDATGERDIIEEKGYQRERRGCEMKIRKKEEKR
jgi:hypothetical protein